MNGRAYNKTTIDCDVTFLPVCVLLLIWLIESCLCSIQWCCVSRFSQLCSGVGFVWRLHRWEVNIFLKILLVDIFIFLLLRMRLWWLYLWVCVRSLWARNVCLLGGDIDWAHLLINLSYLAWGMNMNNIIGLDTFIRSLQYILSCNI